MPAWRVRDLGEPPCFMVCGTPEMRRMPSATHAALVRLLAEVRYGPTGRAMVDVEGAR